MMGASASQINVGSEEDGGQLGDRVRPEFKWSGGVVYGIWVRNMLTFDFD